MVHTTRVRLASPTGQVSELASEMKSYEKTRPGSNVAVDRRQEGSEADGAMTQHAGEELP